MTPRKARPEDLEPLARLWFESWRDAHADILSPEIVADRSLDGFRQRLRESSEAVRTIGGIGKPLGLTVIDGAELNQFYVDREARGTGIATLLMKDAESRLREAGVAAAWLDCAIENSRAARFYEKQGWLMTGTVTITLPLQTGRVPLDVWRFEKTLTPAIAEGCI